jgi:hypothetical protein
MKVKQQDMNLGVLEASIERLGHLSLNISREIKEQNQLLDEVDIGVTEAQDKAEFITRKTKELIDASGYF